MGKSIVQVRNNVKALRREKRMTQSELAKRASCTRSTIAKIESGERNPSLETAYLITTALDEPIQNSFPYISVINGKEVS